VRISDLFKVFDVKKKVEAGSTGVEPSTLNIDKLAVEDDTQYTKIPAELDDVKELAARVRADLNDTIKYIKAGAESPYFPRYAELVEKNYVPIELILDDSVSYPSFTASAVEIDNIEKEVAKSDRHSESFLQTVFLHLQRAEVLDVLFNKAIDDILKPKEPIVVKDKAGKVVLVSERDKAGKVIPGKEVQNNRMLSYLLGKAKTELTNILEWSVGLRKEYENPIAEELKDFISYYIPVAVEGSPHSLQYLLQNYLKNETDVWTPTKQVFTVSYGNTLQGYLEEVMTLQLVKMASSIGDEVDDFLDGLASHIAGSESRTLPFVRQLISDAAADLGLQIRKNLAAKEAKLESEQEARLGSVKARTLQRIINVLENSF